MIPRLEIIWTENARAELFEIAEFIAEDKPIAAQKWIERIFSSVENAALTPFVGRMVPEFNVPFLREVICGNYRVVYRVSDTRLEVLSVFHGHRNL